MVDQRDGETNLKTFNTAKKYAEDIIFPMMESYQRYLRQSDFGCEELADANSIPEDIREIQRFNGLKASNDVLFNLLNTIKSTILLKGNKDEKAKMEEILETLTKLKKIFNEHKERFFIIRLRGMTPVESLDREYFEKIKSIIVVCYSNIEILMTRNKLLFADANDDFMTDSEIKEQIMREYTDG